MPSLNPFLSKCRTTRVEQVALAFAIAIGTIMITLTGSTYPNLLLTGFLAVSGVYTLYIRNRISLAAAIGLMCVIGAVYRMLITGQAPSLIGIDPVWYSKQAQIVAETGQTADIESGFYSVAATYISLLVLIGEVTGLSVETITLIISSLFGLALPLLSATIVRRAAPKSPPSAAVATAGLVAVGANSVRYSYTPVAQTLGMVLLLMVIFLLLQLVRG